MSTIASQLNSSKNASYQSKATHMYSSIHQPNFLDNSNLSLKQLISILNRNKLFFTVIVSMVLAITLAYTLSIKPSYRANAIIQIEREAVSFVDFGQINKSPGLYDVNKDPFFRTRYEMLRGRVLSQEVIKTLGLKESLVNKKSSSWMSVSGALNWAKMQFSADKTLPRSPRITDYNELFQSHLGIQPIMGTHLVEVLYEAPSAEEAQQVVTTLIEVFIKLQMETKSETGEYAKAFLSKQLLESGGRLEGAEKALAQYANSKNIFRIDEKNTRHIKKFKNLDNALVKAEINKIKAESLYEQMVKGGVVTALLNNKVISDLKAMKYKIDGDIHELLKVYKPSHPKIKRLRQQLFSANNKLKKESGNIQAALKADFLAAQSQEERIRGELGQFKDEMMVLQDNSLQYNRLKRELKGSEKLYNSLLQRLEEVNVASAANTSSISILEPAVLPVSNYRPRRKVNMLIGLVSGILLGLGLVFLKESLKAQKLHSFEELEKHFNLPVLGRIPQVKKRGIKKQLDKIVQDVPFDPVAEAYQILSANIQLMSSGLNQRVLLVTSANAGEGKSVTASNLAYAYALMGKRVLLIDADMRKPTLHNKININNDVGLSDYLKGETNIVGVTKPVQDAAGLFVITAGKVDKDPVSLLSHDRMKFLINQGSTVFDYVIVDGPPAVGFADTLLLSSLVTSTLIVAKESTLDAVELGFVLSKFERIKNNVIGFLLVKVKSAEARDKYYLDYRERLTTDLNSQLIKQVSGSHV